MVITQTNKHNARTTTMMATPAMTRNNNSSSSRTLNRSVRDEITLLAVVPVVAVVRVVVFGRVMMVVGVLMRQTMTDVLHPVPKSLWDESQY